MMSACGGKDTPIGAAMFDQLDGLVDEAVRQEDADLVLRRGAVDAARATSPGTCATTCRAILSNEWDQLRDLAYEGSTDFIPALHAFGMPQAEWSPADMQSTMMAIAEQLRESTPKTQEEAVEKDPKQEEQRRAAAPRTGRGQEAERFSASLRATVASRLVAARR